MDVKLEPCMLEYIKVQLKDEEEEVSIEALAPMCFTPLPVNIKQESIETLEQGSPDARLRTYAASLRGGCAQTNLSTGSFQDKLHLVTPFLAVNLGDVPHASWRHEYLVDYRPQGKILTCMVCGSGLFPVTLATIQQHVLKYHPHSLNFNFPERLCILEAWSETKLQLEVSEKNTLHVYNSRITKDQLGDIATSPAEIEVAIDSDELPEHWATIRGKAKANSCAVLKKTLGKQVKKSISNQSKPGLSEKGTKKTKKNVPLENTNVVKSQPRSSDPAKGPFYKYTSSNMAPTEINSFTDGSFPKGFVLKLFSRAEPGHARTKNLKPKSPTLSSRACLWKSPGPAKRNTKAGHARTKNLKPKSPTLSSRACLWKGAGRAKRNTKAAVEKQNGRLKSKGGGVLTLSVRVCSGVSQPPEINRTSPGRKRHSTRRSFKLEVDGHLSMDEKPASKQRPFLAQWRDRYLVDCNLHSEKRLLCLVCGKGMNSMQSSNIRRHAQRCHPYSLTYTPAERKTILDEWLGMGGVWPCYSPRK